MTHGAPVEIQPYYRLGVLRAAREGLVSGDWKTDDVMRAMKRVEWLDRAAAVSDACREAARLGY